MRGTSVINGAVFTRRRFIPAHAGNIPSSNLLVFIAPVHPRTCGEHIRTVHVVRYIDGSSPHMRGTCHIDNIPLQQARFIPAHAGNIRRAARRRCGPTVHPRTCGEHVVAVPLMFISGGSSPHMRGTFLQLIADLVDQRFIPAHAGNIARRDRYRGRPPVHPRTCGEHATAFPDVAPESGSSPHMRGTYRRPDKWDRKRRFIPAHAGNIRPGRLRTTNPPVHPRTCGEHLR